MRNEELSSLIDIMKQVSGSECKRIMNTANVASNHFATVLSVNDDKTCNVMLAGGEIPYTNLVNKTGETIEPGDNVLVEALKGNIGNGYIKLKQGISDVSGAPDSIAWSKVYDTPSTLNGYGIQDAKIENGTITLGANSITPISVENVPVKSVNSKTGNVVLSASDVKALPDDTVIPTKTSQLTNDSGYVIDANYVHTDNNFTNVLKTQIGTNKTNIDNHIVDTSNPHKVTKEQVGLSNVDNVKQWSESNHPTTLGGYGITDGVNSTQLEDLSDRVDTNESDIKSIQTEVGNIKTNYVPNTRTINGKALSNNITLDANDVSALSSDITYVSSVDGSSGAVTTNAVKYVEQTLTEAQKTQVRTNIGAGTSSFDGDYNSLTNKPTIDTTLSTTSKNAVENQAVAIELNKKYDANNQPSYPVTSVDGDLGDVILSDVKYIQQTLTDEQKIQARQNIGAGTSSFSGDYEDLSNKPNIPAKTSDLTNDSGFITQSDIAVKSVNGKTGAVNLTATDVNALPNQAATTTELGGVKVGNGLTIDSNGVLSATGGGIADAVDWSNVQNKPTTLEGYGITDGATSSQLETLTTRVNTNEDNITMAESDIESLQTDTSSLKTDMTAVKSAVTTLQNTYVPNTRKVNGKALNADITLTASDIGALPSTTEIPTKTSDLDNDSGFITSAPVTSVNSKTGAVTLGAGDVGALPTTGGTLTGNLKVGSASLGTNGYVVGTWLQGTAANHLTTAATKIAVQDTNGWIYHRTASEILSDISAVPTSRTINGKALTTDITLTSTDLGMGDTSNIIYGEDAVNVEATTPINADTLEGHGASYFVSQTEFGSLANVARSGSYNDLSNTPSQDQLRAIYVGTTDPASSLGADGDIYIKYNG